MRKISNLTKVALGVSSALMAGGANAHALAQADLNVINFILTRGGSGAGLVGLNSSDFSQINVLDTLNNTAVLNPGGTDFHTASNPIAPSTDALQASVGANPHGQNQFTADTPPPTATFARADSLLTGASITGFGVSTGENASAISETSIATNANGNSTGNILDTTSFQFMLSHPISDIGVSFDASTFLQAWTAPGSLPGTLAGSSINWELTLADGVTGATLVDWKPDGSITTGTQTGIFVLQEGCDLQGIATATFNQPTGITTCSGHFQAISSVALLANHPYSFSISHQTQSHAAEVNAVPEPASLALLGIALAGMGFASRRRKAA